MELWKTVAQEFLASRWSTFRRPCELVCLMLELFSDWERRLSHACIRPRDACALLKDVPWNRWRALRLHGTANSFPRQAICWWVDLRVFLWWDIKPPPNNFQIVFLITWSVDYGSAVFIFTAFAAKDQVPWTVTTMNFVGRYIVPEKQYYCQYHFILDLCYHDII